MSDFIKHECGIAFIRLRKPLQYYIDKYGTPVYGLNKLYLMMEKQHNRGQDGAGVATIKLDPKPGMPYIDRTRSISGKPIADVFQDIYSGFRRAEENNPSGLKSEEWLKEHIPFAGEVMLGHLRYGTHGENDLSMCHPFIRHNNWMTRNLVVAGNFNMTNNDELFGQLVELGQHPRENKDTVTVLEKIGHFLDVEVQGIFDKYKDQGYSNREITDFIIQDLNLHNILKRSARDFDGGYVIAGMLGHGDAFVMRDPSGIRPVHYYYDDEMVVVTSERPCIQTALNVPAESIKEFGPGESLLIPKDGDIRVVEVNKPRERRSCSFERIYFSRGTDIDIYQERKRLGFQLTHKVLKAVDYDWENTVFSFIPNTAEVAFYGLMQGLDQ
jgi:amidophosphoribosyltransferase